MEHYTLKPCAVQVFPVDGGTDIILRRNITETSTEDGTPAWMCEERQFRHRDSVSADEIESDFETWWNYNGSAAGQTAEARIADLEEALDLILSGG